MGDGGAGSAPRVVGDRWDAAAGGEGGSASVCRAVGGWAVHTRVGSSSVRHGAAGGRGSHQIVVHVSCFHTNVRGLIGMDVFSSCGARPPAKGVQAEVQASRAGERGAGAAAAAQQSPTPTHLVCRAARPLAVPKRSLTQSLKCLQREMGWRQAAQWSASRRRSSKGCSGAAVVGCRVRRRATALSSGLQNLFHHSRKAHSVERKLFVSHQRAADASVQGNGCRQGGVVQAAACRRRTCGASYSINLPCEVG